MLITSEQALFLRSTFRHILANRSDRRYFVSSTLANDIDKALDILQHTQHQDTQAEDHHSEFQHINAPQVEAATDEPAPQFPQLPPDSPYAPLIAADLATTQEPQFAYPKFYVPTKQPLNQAHSWYVERIAPHAGRFVYASGETEDFNWFDRNHNHEGYVSNGDWRKVSFEEARDHNHPHLYFSGATLYPGEWWIQNSAGDWKLWTVYESQTVKAVGGVAACRIKPQISIQPQG